MPSHRAIRYFRLAPLEVSARALASQLFHRPRLRAFRSCRRVFFRHLAHPRLTKFGLVTAGIERPSALSMQVTIRLRMDWTWVPENLACRNSTLAELKTLARSALVSLADEPAKPIRSLTTSRGCMENTP